MYTWEIENFLKERDFIVNKDEYVKIINLVDNPQITNVVYHKDTNKHTLTTSDNVKLTFSVN